MKKYRRMLSAGMSAVLTRSDVASQRPHWLAGAGGFESQMSVPKLAFEVWPEFPFHFATFGASEAMGTAGTA
jgi:hypothetical protein